MNNNNLPQFLTDSCIDASMATRRSSVEPTSKGVRKSADSPSVGDDENKSGGKKAFCYMRLVRIALLAIQTLFYIRKERP